MGVIYNKSVSSKYQRYFESHSNFIKYFNKFSLETSKVIQRNIADIKPWETGSVGIPLSYTTSKNEIVVDHTDSHTLVIGPTGSKKSRLIAMPMVRILASSDTKESMIISDPKAEIYNRTAAFLEEQGYKIFTINLRAPLCGNCWNPLAIPYTLFCSGDTNRAYEFANDIAENLMKSDQTNNDPFWNNSAGSLLYGLILLLFKYCKENNKGIEYVHMGNVVNLRNKLLTGSGIDKLNPLWKYAKEDHIIRSALIGTVETANETKAGILSTFDQKMAMFSIQPSLLYMLSLNDIDLDLFTHSPTAIYLILPDEKTGYHGLVSLFIKQSYEYIIYTAQNNESGNNFDVGKLKNRLNYVLDEFSSLPTIKDFPAMITASRSRNIRFTLIIQSKNQLVKRYNEEAETIQTNCNNWVFLTSRELVLLREISELCGETSLNPRNPILSVAALQRLDKESGEVLILSGRHKPLISFLPDIDQYDKKIYKYRDIPPREVVSIEKLDFALNSNTLHNNSQVKKNEYISSMQNRTTIDDLLQRIDKQITELEKSKKTIKVNIEEDNQGGHE